VSRIQVSRAQHGVSKEGGEKKKRAKSLVIRLKKEPLARLGEKHTYQGGGGEGVV